MQFNHLSTGDGLPQSSVIAIAQDQQDLLWFGTRDGLSMYDGRRFRVFRHQSGDETSISNDDILSLVATSDGNLWVGTHYGLNYYDVRRDVFKRYLHHANEEGSISDNVVRAVLERSNGDILVGTANGLNLIERGGGEVKRIASKNSEGDPLNLDVYAMHEDGSGRIWIGGGDKLFCLESLFPLKVQASYPIQRRVQSIVQVPEGQDQLLIVGTHDGLFTVDKKGKLSRFADAFRLESLLVHEDIRGLAYDEEGHLWVGTYNGVNRISQKGEVLTAQHNPGDSESLSKNTIKSVFKDRSGSIWIGAYYGGVNMWDPSNGNFQNIKASDGLSYSVISSLSEDAQNVYIGTEGGGINVLDKKSRGLTYWQDEKADNVKSLYVDSLRKTCWAGTFNAGVLVWNTQTGKKLKSLQTDQGLSSDAVYDITPYQDHFIILSTFGGGINIVDKQSHTVLNDHLAKQPGRLQNSFVRKVLVDRKDNVWLGTNEGLVFISKEHFLEQPYHYKNYLYDSANQTGASILDLFQGADGTIWAGTKETGLHYFDGELFVRVPLVQEASQTIHSMQEDAKGILWVSSNQGIMSFDPTSNEVQVYQESDGLVSNEYNSGASLRSRDGLLYFGGPNGITVFDPQKLKTNSYTPKVVLTTFEIYNENIQPGDGSGILEEAFRSTKSIELKHNEANFTIHFALPSYVHSKSNTYAYRLVGLDERWKYTTVNEASFSLQDPGNYQFEIKGSNGDGVWGTDVSKLSIYIHPAPWRTWWAYLIYVLVIFSSLYFLLKIIQSRSELAANLELEHRENEQQKELNTAKLQFFTNISHEFRTPLTLILGPLQRIIQEYRGDRTLFKQLVSIEKNANQLLKLINQLMEFRKLENNQTKLYAAEGNLVKFVKEVYLSFKPYAQLQGFDYHFSSVEEEIRVYYDRDRLERVLFNLISNAFKYDKDQKAVHIHVARSDENVLISVSDKGIGMSQEQIAFIFDRFYQVRAGHESKEEMARGTGIGLSLVKGIVELHKGTIEVKSSPNNGSCFTISLPLGMNHLPADQVHHGFKDSESLEVYEQHHTKEEKQDFEIKNTPSSEARKILVVEDNQEVRKFIVDILTSDGYNAQEAENGKEGVIAAKQLQPDLIISDVMMPVMDGIELCSTLKGNVQTSHIPVILLTARTSLIFKFEGLESGADDYINKPFNVKEFLLKVKNLLATRDHLKKQFDAKEVLSLSNVTITSLDETLFKKAIEVVENHIDNQFFDIPLFCSELGLSRTMLFTKIKAWTSLTPNDFIHSVRMKRAAQLLETKKANVSQISYEVGYKNPKYFSKMFQKHYAMTPTEYANKFESAI